MSRQEFIDRLRASLNSSLAPSMVAEHVRYYEDYIRSEMQQGKSEESVLASLGDPRLIARTIIQTNSTEDGGYQEINYQNESGEVSRHFSIPGWVWILVVILVLVVILSVVMSVLSFLAPILIPSVVVGFLIKLFRDWLN